MLFGGLLIGVVSFVAVVVSCALLVSHYRSENLSLSVQACRYAEKSLQVAEGDARYRVLFDRAPVGVVVWEPGFKVVEWNPQAERVFGWLQKDILGKNFLSCLVPINVRDRVIRDVATLFVDGDLQQEALPHVTRDGRSITCQWHHSVLRNEQGNPVQVISLCVDVTQAQKLQRENAVLNEVIGLSLDAAVFVLDFDAGGEVVYVTEAASRMLGRSKSELLGGNPANWDFIVSSERGLKTWASLVRKGASFPMSLVQEDGTVVPVEVAIRSVEHLDTHHGVCYLREMSSPISGPLGVRSRHDPH